MRSAATAATSRRRSPPPPLTRPLRTHPTSLPSSSSGGGRGGGRGGDSGGGKPLAKRKKLGASIGIAKFAAAKASTWDKREKQEKERALNAARVNAYRKLQKRMGPAALAPSVPLDQVRAVPARLV